MVHRSDTGMLHKFIRETHIVLLQLAQFQREVHHEDNSQKEIDQSEGSVYPQHVRSGRWKALVNLYIVQSQYGIIWPLWGGGAVTWYRIKLWLIYLHWEFCVCIIIVSISNLQSDLWNWYSFLYQLSMIHMNYQEFKLLFPANVAKGMHNGFLTRGWLWYCADIYTLSESELPTKIVGPNALTLKAHCW